jgi:DNA segregation ATPase FtsK/SpoIIIE, S-DNA-T family
MRILAPIPGKSAIGVEVPNAQRQLVAVGDVLNTPHAKQFPGPLSVAVGRDIDGKPVMVDLAKMPHVLVAGTTGSGKSSCINSLLTSILMRTTPDDVRLILIDPKMVELSQYNGLPHLLTQVVTNPKKAANALAWAVEEMEKRYEMLARLGFRDIAGYNAAVERGALDDPYADDPAKGLGAPPMPAPTKLSMILIVVDELADLMMVAARDVEESICRIAQKARAVGIHLVIATQRPSVNVITGLIKANVPSRFAFAVSSLTDSRVIIDQPGAERLIGQGDMLMLTVSSNVPQRVQGNFVSEDEVRAIVGFWRKQTQGLTRTIPGVDAGNEPGTRDATTGHVGFSAAANDDGFGEPGRIESPTPKMVGGTQGAFVYGGAPELTASGSSASGGAAEDDDGDDMLEQAMELVVRSQLGSTSMLQRKLRVGFARAGRIMDLLENRGIVGPSTGSKAREVLMTVEEFEALHRRD